MKNKRIFEKRSEREKHIEVNIPVCFLEQVSLFYYFPLHASHSKVWVCGKVCLSVGVFKRGCVQQKHLG